MPKDADLEIVSSSVGGSGSGSSGDGPARLMRSDDRTELDTGDYPHVTAHVNVESGSGTISDVDTDTFDIYEDGSEREVVSLEFIDDALDLVFVFDDTGSMGGEIDGAKAGVTDLTDSIDSRDLDARYALVSFKDDVEVDQRFTSRASNLKSSVDQLRASAGGDAPEANFDAIERALALDWRSDAQRVIVDITDAPSHYAGDGSGFSDYTFGEVASDLRDAEVTFISVGPDEENRTDSLKSLAGEVGGLWTDISGVRSSSTFGSSSPDNFQRVLERISSLIASTYVLTYFSCAPPGERTDVEIALDHSDYRRATDTARVDVPGRFDLHPDCKRAGGVTDEGGAETDTDEPSITKVDESEEETGETPGITQIDDASGSDGTPSVTRDDGGTPGVTSAADEPDETLGLVLMPDRTEVRAGEEVAITVRDGNGSRLEGATVEAPNDAAETDRRGTCRLTFSEPAEATITATKAGDDSVEYESTTETITVREA